MSVDCLESGCIGLTSRFPSVFEMNLGSSLGPQEMLGCTGMYSTSWLGAVYGYILVTEKRTRNLHTGHDTASDNLHWWHGKVSRAVTCIPVNGGDSIISRPKALLPRNWPELQHLVFPLGTILWVGGNEEGFIRVRHFVVPPSGDREWARNLHKVPGKVWWKLTWASLQKYTLQFVQIQFAFWTNTFSNLDKYKLEKVALTWWKLAQASIADFSRPQIWIYRFHLSDVEKRSHNSDNIFSNQLYFSAKSKPISLLTILSIFTWSFFCKSNQMHPKF